MIPRLTLPRRTVRLRLTALYGVLVLASGALMLTLTYALAANWLPWPGLNNLGWHPAGINRAFGAPPGGNPGPGGPFGGVRARDVVALVEAQLTSQRSADLHQLLLELGLALAALAVLSVALGWWAAGRVLRPLRAMTDSARRISEDNLGARLAFAGPRDELKDLADTLDGLFARIEAAFEEQRRFVANASHELRTPLARSRTLLEVALDDPDATVDSLKAVGRRVLASGEQQERLIDALLVLARSQRGLDRRTPFDLAQLVGQTTQIAPDGARLERDLGPAPTAGDPRLVRRLVANLVDNAVRHNVPGGWLAVRTGIRDGRAVLRVENSGPVVDPRDVPALFEPFRRAGEPRVGRPDGLGVGLSIVAAVAAAHGAQISATPLPDGGLRIDVSFPLAASPPPPAAIPQRAAVPDSVQPDRSGQRA